MWRTPLLIIAAINLILISMKQPKKSAQNNYIHGMDERIINGHDANICDGFAVLEYKDHTTACGAVIYRNKWNQPGIVTARHCMIKENPLQFARIYPNNCQNQQAITCEIAQWRTFSNKPFSSSNDIAIASITSCDDIINFDALNILPIANPDDPRIKTSKLIGKEVKLIGKGLIHYSHDHHEYDLPKDVQELTSKIMYINDYEICSTSPESSVCYGDSGSAMTMDNNVTIGILSHDKFACRRGSPSCYTRLSVHYHWLMNSFFESTELPRKQASGFMGLFGLCCVLFIFVYLFLSTITVAAVPASTSSCGYVSV